jgi:hypothetical protein
MYVVLWRFRPLKDRESEFERAYGPSGEWTRLFQHGEGYLGTELLQRSDDPREYLDECCVVCKVKRGPSEFPVQRSIRWPNPSLPHSWPSWKRP